MGGVLREADGKREGPRGLPDVPAVRVLGGEHPVLAGLRGPQEGAESRADRGEGSDHLRGLRVHPVAARGQPRLAGPGNHQPQHDRAQSAHVRRGAIANLHAHAPRLVPAVRKLAHLQGNMQNVRRRTLRVTRHSRQLTMGVVVTHGTLRWSSRGHLGVIQGLLVIQGPHGPQSDLQED